MILAISKPATEIKSILTVPLHLLLAVKHFLVDFGLIPFDLKIFCMLNKVADEKTTLVGCHALSR